MDQKIINKQSNLVEMEVIEQKAEIQEVQSYDTSLPALVGEIESQMALFADHTGQRFPNVLVLNNRHYTMLQLGLEKLLHKETVMDVQSMENKMVMKQVTFFKGMRVILINQVTRPAVGYIEFKDAGLVVHTEGINPK